jgi:sugar phosphate isomerase/epimerase
MAGEKCFAFCYDVGHGAILGIDPCYAFEKLGHRLEALHIHDNSGMTDDHTAPYLGIVNWKRFIKALRDSDYKGDLNFETFKISRAFPKELVPDVVKLISATGRYFKAQLEAEE